MNVKTLTAVPGIKEYGNVRDRLTIKDKYEHTWYQYEMIRDTYDVNTSYNLSNTSKYNKYE